MVQTVVEKVLFVSRAHTQTRASIRIRRFMAGRGKSPLKSFNLLADSFFLGEISEEKMKQSIFFRPITVCKGFFPLSPAQTMPTTPTRQRSSVRLKVHTTVYYNDVMIYYFRKTIPTARRAGWREKKILVYKTHSVRVEFDMF